MASKPVLFLQRQALISRAGNCHVKTRLAEIVPDHPGEPGIIFNQKNFLGHCSPQSMKRVSAAMASSVNGAELFDPPVEQLALLRGQHFGHISQCADQILC